eukprot:4394326-Pyramimonas_sp.AAC.1
MPRLLHASRGSEKAHVRVPRRALRPEAPPHSGRERARGTPLVETPQAAQTPRLPSKKHVCFPRQAIV